MTVTKTHIMSDETGVRIAEAIESLAREQVDEAVADALEEAVAEQVAALDEEVANGSY